jgi:hypothetical protein
MDYTEHAPRMADEKPSELEVQCITLKLWILSFFIAR